MDELGVLTQSMGLKPQGKSAPMASFSSSSSSSATTTMKEEEQAAPFYKPQNVNSGDWDHLFGAAAGASPNNPPPPSTHSGSSSSFGFVGFDSDSMFFGGFHPTPSVSASHSSSFSAFDVFDSMEPGFKSKSSASAAASASASASASVVKHHHHQSPQDGGLFGASMMASTSTPPQLMDDLLGDFAHMGLQSNGTAINPNNSNHKNAPASSSSSSFSDDDLIPGFGSGSVSGSGSGSGSHFGGRTTRLSLNNGKTSPDAPKSPASSSIDELEIFATAKVRNTSNKQPDILSGQVDVGTFIDEDMFGLKNKGRVPVEVEKERETAHSAQRVNENDIESFFSTDAQTRSSQRPAATSVTDSVFDTLFQSKGGPEVSNSAGPSSNKKTSSSSINVIDDFSFMFGAGVPSEEFQEVEGENEERRAARWKRHQGTKERMAKAVSEMNQRDFQTQQEQEERHRVSETVNTEIKQWVAGKEGNLRALLSTLQSVLWPECGWRPVSLTDLITSTSVKKAYKKATLCIHPDKLQQKGADARQKYIAEKVFGLLKEAWNKFNSEELR